MKKQFLFPLLYWSMFCCFLWGCAPRNDSGTGGLFTAVQTPVPSPSPAPVLILLGAGPDADFSLGAARAAEKGGFRFLSGGNLSTLSAYDGAETGVLLLYADGPEEGEALHAPLSMPAYGFCTGGATLPEGLPGTVCTGGEKGDLLLEAMFSFVPFATPVRALGLMSGNDSPGAIRWKAATEAGKVLSRGVYRQTGREESAGEWLKKQLVTLYPGMVDCIYAETASLALLAETALTETGRTDIRIFSDEMSGALLARMEESATIAAAAGIDGEQAGYLAGENAMSLLTGSEGGVQSTLEPYVVFTEQRTNP